MVARAERCARPLRPSFGRHTAVHRVARLNNNGILPVCVAMGVGQKQVADGLLPVEQEGPAARTPRISRSWHLSRRVREDHGQTIFGLAINLYSTRRQQLFATTGSNRATIYELIPGGNIEVRQVYVDQDPTESYFSCAWSTAAWEDGAPLLAIAGQLGIIRVIDTEEQCVSRTLMGHGNSINDLRFHPYKPSLLLSASKDESIRLWDVRAVVCVAIFSGDQGHRGEVLSLDVHLDGQRFVSGGMDNAVKVWSLKSCAHAIDKAAALPARPTPRATAETAGGGERALGSFRPAQVQAPEFSSSKVHGNYVDCVRWLGDHVVSKSTHSKLVVWKPAAGTPGSWHNLWRGSCECDTGPATILAECRYPSSDIWFLRFAIATPSPILVVGNKVGQIFLWDLAHLPSGQPVYAKPLMPTLRLTHSLCNYTVRQTAISADSRTILAVTEDGSVWRWDAASK
jgi:polycomb protein EED